MPIGPAGKLVSGTLALSTATIGGFAVHNILKPKTIGEILQKEESLYLLETSSDKWQELVKKHKETSDTAENKPAKIKDLSLSSSGENIENIENTNKKELQEKCVNLWNTKVSDTEENDKERIKQELRNWCVNSPKAIAK